MAPMFGDVLPGAQQREENMNRMKVMHEEKAAKKTPRRGTILYQKPMIYYYFIMILSENLWVYTDKKTIVL